MVMGHDICGSALHCERYHRGSVLLAQAASKQAPISRKPSIKHVSPTKHIEFMGSRMVGTEAIQIRYQFLFRFPCQYRRQPRHWIVSGHFV